MVQGTGKTAVTDVSEGAQIIRGTTTQLNTHGTLLLISPRHDRNARRCVPMKHSVSHSAIMQMATTTATLAMQHCLDLAAMGWIK